MLIGVINYCPPGHSLMSAFVMHEEGYELRHLIHQCMYVCLSACTLSVHSISLGKGHPKWRHDCLCGRRLPNFEERQNQLGKYHIKVCMW